MASDDLRARIARIRSDAERSVHPDWRDINPTWVLLNELDRLTALNDELRGKVTALEASYEVVAADAMAHGLCSMKRHSLLQRAEKAEAELARLNAELHRHAACAVCGHERHRHGYEPIIRRDWCSDCPTANDLHTFKEA